MRPRAGAEPADARHLMSLEIHPGRLTLDVLQAIHAGGVELTLDVRLARWRSAPVPRSCSARRRATAAVYGVNTGFGKLASTRIEAEPAATLQLNLIRSHSVGVGEPLQPAVVRLMLALKAASLARGHSGVREEVVETLIAAHNAGLVPYIPSQGSVGASGDLAPLAHMTLALAGEGEMLVEGERVPAAPALRAAGVAPLTLEAKEGLALINGTQVSTALALHALLVFEPVLEAGAGGRRDDGRCRPRQRRPVRSAHPRAARPAGADRRRPVLPRPARRQRDPPFASRGRRPRAGPVQPALPAAGGRRLPRPAAPCARWCCCARPTR